MLLKNLAPVLAEFGRDPRHAQVSIDFLFRSAGDSLVPLEKPIFIQFETLPDGDFPNGDIVCFRACEIEQGSALTDLAHNAKIYLQSGPELYRRPPRPL